MLVARQTMLGVDETTADSETDAETACRNSSISADTTDLVELLPRRRGTNRLVMLLARSIAAMKPQ